MSRTQATPARPPPRSASNATATDCARQATGRARLPHQVALEIAEAAVPQVQHLAEVRVRHRVGEPQLECELRVAVLVDHRLGERLVLIPLVHLLEGGLGLGGEAGPDLDLVALA